MNTPPTIEVILDHITNQKGEFAQRGQAAPEYLYAGGWQQQAIQGYIDDQASRGLVIRDPNVLGKPSTLMGLEIVPVQKPDHLAVS